MGSGMGLGLHRVSVNYCQFSYNKTSISANVVQALLLTAACVHLSAALAFSDMEVCG